MAHVIGTTAERIAVPMKRWNLRWLIISIIVVCVISGLLGSYFAFWRNPAPTASSVPSQGQIANPVPQVPPPAPTSPPQEQREKVLGPTNQGAIIFDMGEKGHVAYGLGSMFTPPGSPPFPQYGFPLYVSKTDGYSWTTLAVIPDPGINQIGNKWESTLIKDPNYENFILKVELTRVAEVQKYDIRFSFSPDNGKGWLTAEFPP